MSAGVPEEAACVSGELRVACEVLGAQRATSGGREAREADVHCGADSEYTKESQKVLGGRMNRKYKIIYKTALKFETVEIEAASKYAAKQIFYRLHPRCQIVSITEVKSNDS